MDSVKPLPTYLVQRYHGWKATTFEGQSLVVSSIGQ